MKLGLVASGFVLLLGACGGATAIEPRTSSEEISAQEVRSVLIEANEVARDYGRDHLGHFLRMTTHKLVLAGLELPETVKLTVTPNHTGYCITSESANLPDSHAWSVATATPKTDAPSPNDNCPDARY